MPQPPKPRTARRTPLPRGTLTEERIVGAALDLVDEVGLGAFTMRGLAKELGCEAMSLYKHVADKQALLDLVAEEALADFSAPHHRARWDNRIRSTAEEIRRLALAHPHVFPLIAVRLPTTAVALAPIEVLLGGLRETGLDGDDLLSAFWALVAYLTGALIAETGALSGTPPLFPFEQAAPDLTTLPNVAGLAQQMAECDYATEYRRGLEIFLSVWR